MKRYAQIIALLSALCGVVIGCVGIHDTNHDTSPFIYPKSQFESQTNFTAWAGMERVGITNQADYAREMLTFFSCPPFDELSTREAQNALRTDPFLTTPNLPFVTFMTFEPAERVAKYYEKQFDNNGWHKVRGILLPEECLGGGDWIRVYRKGESLVHIHIMGPWKRDRDELCGLAEGRYAQRLIMFRFIRIDPTAFLGPDYQNKTWDGPPTEDT